MHASAKFAFSIATFVLTSAVGLAQQTPQPSVRVMPEELRFVGVPGGSQTAVLYGDPKQSGVFVTRVRFPAGLKVPAHWHPDAWRTVVVLSGTLYFGLGEQWDETKLTALPAGTFFSEPSKTPHFAWAKDGEVIIQVTGMGPSGTVSIPPAKQ